MVKKRWLNGWAITKSLPAGSHVHKTHTVMRNEDHSMSAGKIEQFITLPASASAADFPNNMQSISETGCG